MQEDFVFVYLGEDEEVRWVVMRPYFETAVRVFDGSDLIIETVLLVGFADGWEPFNAKGFADCVFAYSACDV